VSWVELEEARTVNPDEPMILAMKAALEPLAKRLRENLRDARRGDADAVHDSRTLIRRLRVGLDVMGNTAFDGTVTNGVARGLRGIERALGPTRDDDVLLEHLDRWLEGVDPDIGAGAAPIRDRLRRVRTRHASALDEHLRRKAARKTLRQLRDLLAHPARASVSPPKNAARVPPTLVHHFMHGQVWRAYEEALAYDVRNTADVGIIHKFRSSCRRLRFTLELFTGATQNAGAVVELLHALQDRLGDLHDHAVAAARIRRWMSRSRVPKTAAARQYLAERLRAQSALVAEFDTERRAFAARQVRLALFTLLNGEGARPARSRALPTDTRHAPLRLVPAA
jgi:CHAD domain-containing protein